MNAKRTSKTVLALNVGSATLKAASYSVLANTAAERPAARQIGRVSVEIARDRDVSVEDNARTQLAQVALGLPELREVPAVVAHRIVHGGDRLGPIELTRATLAELQALSPLAPLHQPPALALVRAAIERWPGARQISVFDTSWHQTMPAKHRVLPLPYALHGRGVKRYGFHGLAFQSTMRLLGRVAPELADGRIVLAHLGGGSSLCAVLDGDCVNTTMGMTPLGGIPMANRPGSLDPGVLLHLQRELAMSTDEIDRLLWRESGLNGISGESGDMRTLLASGSDGARLAIDVYVGGVVQGIASMAACIGGIDALAFSGGVGTHAPDVRAHVAAQLEWMGLLIDPVLNRNGALDISSSSATARTFVLSVDEETEMVNALALREP